MRDRNKRVIAIMIIIGICLLSTSIMGVANTLMNKVSANDGMISEEATTKVSSEDDNINKNSMKCTFYDYYSDSQVTTSDLPGKITDAIEENMCTFTRFNRRILDTKKYADSLLSPAKWPLYAGWFITKAYGDNVVDMGFYTDESDTKNFDTNFWLGANTMQTPEGVKAATQGLVDEKLDEAGYLTQSNPLTGKSCRVPFFDKEFLINTKHTGSQLSLGGVKENVFFPLIESEENGITYYSFDSSKDTVTFNENGEIDYLGKNNEQVLDQYGYPGFFPYNVANEGNSESLNYGFGVKMEVGFNVTEDGKIGGQNMVFEFSGDDDLWVFIDGYLALDVGGIHSIVQGRIDFAEQSANVNVVKNNVIAFSQKNFELIEEKEYSVEEMQLLGINGKTTSETGYLYYPGTDFPKGLKDSLSNTAIPHKMTIFYMERGKGGSDLNIKFNMPITEKKNNNNNGINNGIKIINGDTL